MANQLQIVDPDDETSVLYDFHDPTGANSQLYGGVTTRLITDVSFGTADVGTAQNPARRKVTFRHVILGTNYDALARAVGVLGNYLEQGATLRWVPDGSAERRYIDCDPTSAPALLDGRLTSLSDAVWLFQTPDGVQIELEGLPGLRGDLLLPGVNGLPNATLLRDSDGNGVPDGWNSLGGSHAVSGLWDSYSHNGTGGLILPDSGAPAASSGQVWWLSCEMRAQSASAGVGITMPFRTSGNVTISEPSAGCTVDGKWHRVQLQATAPATTHHVLATAQAFGGGTSGFQVRNVQLELSSAAAPSPFRVRGELLHVDPASAGFATLLPVYNPGTAPAPCQLQVSFPDASSNIVEVDYALVSNEGIQGRRKLADYLNLGGPFYAQLEATNNGWTVTLGGSTTSTVDANASGGNTARFSPGSLPTQLQLVATLARTSVLDAIRGRHTVYLRVKGGSVDLYGLQLRWGGLNATIANDVAYHDCTLATGTKNYVYVNLGEIDLPAEINVALGNLTLELWANENPGTSNLDCDHLLFVPTDAQAIAEAPVGALTSELGSAFGIPKDLGAGDPTWTAGTTQGTDKKLNAINQGAAWAGTGTLGSTGPFSGAGVHVVTFSYAVKAALGSGAYNLEVANVTDNTVAATLARSSFTAGAWTEAVDVLTFTGVAGKTYQPRVTMPNASPPAVLVHSASHQLIVPILQNGQLRSDPGSLPTRNDVEMLDVNGNVMQPWDATDTPVWLPPGLSLVYVNPFDLPNGGYVENQSVLGRTFQVTPTVYRRDYA